jgi:hypothetical protein
MVSEDLTQNLKPYFFAEVFSVFNKLVFELEFNSVNCKKEFLEKLNGSEFTILPLWLNDKLRIDFNICVNEIIVGNLASCDEFSVQFELKRGSFTEARFNKILQKNSLVLEN